MLFTSGPCCLDPLGQPTFAGREGLAKPPLLKLQDAANAVTLGRQLRVATRHAHDDLPRKLADEGPIDAQDPPEADRAPHDAP